MDNLGEIFTYLKDTLLQGAVDEISEVIGYLNDAQDLISDKFPIQAPLYTTTLTTNSLTLPNDFKSLKKLKIDDIEIDTYEDPWAGELELNENYTSGTVKLYYYKKPTQLDATDLDQIPDIDARYWNAMAEYAAKVYYLVDDDDDMLKKFRDQFYETLASISTAKKTITRFKNVW